MRKYTNIRVAWLLPVAWYYWHPLLSYFTELFPQTTVFTGLWPGFTTECEGSFTVKQVGKWKVIASKAQSSTGGYGSSFTYLSPSIVGHLLRFKPHVIFSNAFGIWTMLALLFKPLGRWQVVIIYDGSSPGVDYLNSGFRLWLRRVINRFVDAYITNNRVGKAYLTEVIGAKEKFVFARPYLVPDAKTLLQASQDTSPIESQLKHPIFLFVGHIITRKGLRELLEACSILQDQGYRDFTLLVVCDGSQREELEAFNRNHKLEKLVKFIGRVEYERMGSYFQDADVFVCPSLEEVWGMVVLESMIFGKPVLCSQWAGSVEMVVDGENGYVFDPHQPKNLAELMRRFIDDPSLIDIMGEKSKQIMKHHPLTAVSKSLAEVVELVLSRQEKNY